MGGVLDCLGFPAWGSTAASSPRSPSTPSAVGSSCRSRCSTSSRPPTSPRAGRVALSLAALLTLPGRRRDRAARRPVRRQAGDADRQPAAGGRLRGLPVRRLLLAVALWTVVVTVGRTSFWGSFGIDRHGDLAAGGAGDVVRLPRARCATSASASAGSSPASRSRSAPPRRTTRSWSSTRVVPPGASSCCSAVPPTDRVRRTRDAPGAGASCCATRPTGCCARAARLLWPSDAAQLRHAGLRHHCSACPAG